MSGWATCLPELFVPFLNLAGMIDILTCRAERFPVVFIG